MKKFFFTVCTCFLITAVFAQQDSLPVKNPNKKIDLPSRSADHFMFQLTSDHWTGMPDSINSHQSGFSRGFNAYIMFDKPFRGAKHFSLGIGVGIGTSNIVFKKLNVDVKSTSQLLPFTPLDSTDHFKKYKLASGFLEVPLEFRYFSNPDDLGKSWKIALGGKIGTLVNLHTKGKTLENKNNITINSYTQKENDKKYFNTTRLMATARIGYGIFSLYGSYQLNNILQEGEGPDMKLFQVGFCISGL